MSSEKEIKESNKQFIRAYFKIEDVVIDYMNDKIGARQAMGEIGLHVNYMGCKDKIEKIVNEL